MPSQDLEVKILRILQFYEFQICRVSYLDLKEEILGIQEILGILTATDMTFRVVKKLF